MTTIQIRIAREIIVFFCLSLLVVTMLAICIGVMREALNQGLGISAVMRLVPFALPNALSLAVPSTALLSVCCVYGRMSADNEFTAMQSVGISMLPSMWPAILITALLSVATVGLINVAFTWGFHGIRSVVLSSVDRIAYGVLEREHSFQHDQFSLRVRDVVGRDLIEPMITIRRDDGNTVTINAQSAQLRYDAPSESMELSITRGKANAGENASFFFPDTFIQKVPLNPTPVYDLLTAHPSHMPMRDLPTAFIHQENDVLLRERKIAVHVGFNLLMSRPESNCDSTAQARFASLASSRKRVHRLDVEMHRRWASGFTCFAMSMIGIPLAIRMKAADTFTTFGLVFLPTVLIYYPIFALTLDMAKNDCLMSQGVWIANLLFVTTSIVVMRNLVYKPA